MMLLLILHAQVSWQTIKSIFVLHQPDLLLMWRILKIFCQQVYSVKNFIRQLESVKIGHGCDYLS